MAVVKYQIRRMDLEDTPALTHNGEPIVFTDPAVAAQYAKEQARILGEKLCVKTISDPKWRTREATRFENGTYRYLPWAGSRWWMENQAIWKDHYPHPSVEKPGWIAYTKNAEDGTKDKQTIVRCGSYLKEHFERAMEIHGMSERGLVTQFMQMYGPVEVKFAETEEEMIAAFEHGPNTCMVGKGWPKGRNPAFIYAAGDLQIAYLGDLATKVSARTLVWPMKKTYSRVYGDIAKITKGLERLGYRWGPPIGARVQRVEFRKLKFDPKAPPPSGCFISPYIDKKNQQGGGHLALIDKGDHMIIVADGTPGSHHCGVPDGVTGLYVPREDEHPTFTCERCAAPGQRQVFPVYVRGDSGVEQSWCPQCQARHTFRCMHSRNHFSKDHVKAVEVDGAWWTDHYAAMYATRCEMTRKLCNKADMVLMLINGVEKKVSQEWIYKSGGCFQSHLTNRYWLNKDQIIVKGPDGRAVAYAGKPELKDHTFQCDGCDNYLLLKDRIQHFEDDRLYCKSCVDHIKQYGQTPVSPTRKAFEAQRAQHVMHLDAAE